jgi:hypothetical protein
MRKRTWKWALSSSEKCSLALFNPTLNFRQKSWGRPLKVYTYISYSTERYPSLLLWSFRPAKHASLVTSILSDRGPTGFSFLLVIFLPSCDSVTYKSPCHKLQPKKFYNAGSRWPTMTKPALISRWIFSWRNSVIWRRLFRFESKFSHCKKWKTAIKMSNVNQNCFILCVENNTNGCFIQYSDRKLLASHVRNILWPML